MNYHRRKILKNSFLGALGFSFFNIGLLSFLKSTDIDIKTIGKKSYLVNDWVISKNDLK